MDNELEIHFPVETDLVELIWGDETVYPWNPSDPIADHYFSIQDRSFPVTAWSSNELSPNVESFFAGLEELWNGFKSETESLLVEGYSDLDQQLLNLQLQFGVVPMGIIERIVNCAHSLYQSNLSLLEQLTVCVHSTFPHIDHEDLWVLARPFVYAMRSGDMVERLVDTTRNSQWHTLSDVEQARLGLAIAQVILSSRDTL